MNRRFPLLSIVAKLLAIVGWLLLAIGGIAIVEAVTGAAGFGFIRLLMAPTGVAFIVAGEAIGVLFAIEANTRGSAEALQKPAEQSRGPGAGYEHYVAALENAAAKKDAILASVEEQVGTAEALIARLKNTVADQEDIIERANREIAMLRTQIEQ